MAPEAGGSVLPAAPTPRALPSEVAERMGVAGAALSSLVAVGVNEKFACPFAPFARIHPKPASPALPPELATTFPENSGYVAWVTAAFGPFWGFQVRLYRLRPSQDGAPPMQPTLWCLHPLLAPPYKSTMPRSTLGAWRHAKA